MPQFFIILLKINFVLLLFAAAYYLVLRQLTFYAINRVFLVFGILFSSIYPFIDLSDFFHKQNQQIIAFVPEMNHQIKSLVKPVLLNEYWHWLMLLFNIGVLLMAIRLFLQFASLYKIHQKSTLGYISNFKVRILGQSVSPFSFWQTIYVNPSLHKKEELYAILAHEQIHVKQWHSLDIILAEFSVVFYWFNPGVWLMKRAIKENLEFIADEQALQKGIDKKAYQYGLLNVGKLTPSISLVNNFNLSDLKKRIIMMNVKRSSKLTLSRYLLVLPLLLLVTLAFTISKKDISQQFSPIKKILISTNVLDDLKQEVKSKLIQKTKVKAKFLNNILKPENSNILVSANINDTLDHANTAQSNIKSFELNKAGIVKQKVKAVYLSVDSAISNQLLNQSDEAKRLIEKGETLGAINVDTKNKTVELRAYKLGVKQIDSIRRIKPAVYFNGKRLTPEQLDKIDPNHIKSINFLAENGTYRIHVVGYGKINTP